MLCLIFILGLCVGALVMAIIQEEIDRAFAVEEEMERGKMEQTAIQQETAA